MHPQRATLDSGLHRGLRWRARGWWPGPKAELASPGGLQLTLLAWLDKDGSGHGVP